MTLPPLVLTSGWASGINAYDVISVMGLLGLARVTSRRASADV
jgi:hypothetical protein